MCSDAWCLKCHLWVVTTRQVAPKGISPPEVSLMLVPLVRRTPPPNVCFAVPPHPQVLSPTKFVRPIYAGNGLATVSVAPEFQKLIMASVSDMHT